MAEYESCSTYQGNINWGARKPRENGGRNCKRREIDYVLLSAFGIIGTVLSSQTRQFELTLQRE